MRKFECNQKFESSGGEGERTCKYRCTIIKFDMEKSKLGKLVKKETSRQTNRCRIGEPGTSKRCDWKNCDEKHCHRVKHGE